MYKVITLPLVKRLNDVQNYFLIAQQMAEKIVAVAIHETFLLMKTFI
jgi:hypothetical protein